MERHVNTNGITGGEINGWFGPAFAFFGAGLVAGIAFTIAGSIPGVRVLGALASVASVFGMVIVGYTLRTENPEAWLALGDRARILFAEAASSWRNLVLGR